MGDASKLHMRGSGSLLKNILAIRKHRRGHDLYEDPELILCSMTENFAQPVQIGVHTGLWR